MQRTFKVALFDLDGTLFDTEGQYSVFWGDIGRRFRPDIPHFEHIIKGTTLKQIYGRYFPDADVQQQITPLLQQFEAEMQYTFFEGAREFLDELRDKGIRCAVVTSSDSQKMQNVYRAVPSFASLFDRILTAEDFRASKPHPDCYLRGAAALGADISECVVFEDAYTGLQAGMSSGIFTIGYASGHTPEDLRDKCHYVLTDYRGLTKAKVDEILQASDEQGR